MSLPIKLTLLTVLLLETSATTAAMASLASPVEPLLISQRRPPRRRGLPSRSRFRPRLRARPRIPRRTIRPQRRLVQPRQRVRRPLPSSSRRLSWRVRPIAPAAYRWGGIARGTDCADNNISASELLPKTRRQEARGNAVGGAANPATNPAAIETSSSRFDLTLQSHPTFWIHVENLRPTLMDFTVQNLAGTQQLYEAQFQVDEGTGLVGIAMSESAPALEVGQAYVWQLRIECNPEDPSKDLYLSNEIQRVAAQGVELNPGVSRPTWQSGLAQASDRDRPAFYADAGLWQDAVSALATLRFVDTDNVEVQQDWETMLEGLEMSQFKTAPVLQLF